MRVRCNGLPETHEPVVLGEKKPYEDTRFTDTICSACQAVIMREAGFDEDEIREQVRDQRKSESALRPIHDPGPGIDSGLEGMIGGSRT